MKKSFGCGVGLRPVHYPAIIDKWPKMDWFEAVSENYMDSGGRPTQILEKIRARYPVALHGIALSIGSADPLNQKYLERLKRLVERIGPFIVSDHLCWSGVRGEELHDLLPLPLTEEAVRHVVGRTQAVQEFLGRKILLENVSTYVTYKHSTMPEWEFLREVSRRSGCGILLDINNIYVNSVNHGFNPGEYIKNIPGELVEQFHVAGHTDMGSFLFDTHSAPVIDKVWELYREALELYGPVSTLIEWDEHIPDFEHLAGEAEKAKAIYKQFEGKKPKQERLEIEEMPRASHEQKNFKGTLLEVQESFKSRILPYGEKASELPVSEFLNPQGGVPAEERLSTYANGYVARTEEALSEIYETVRQTLGQEKFSELCHAYAGRYPSLDYNLCFAGRELPELIGELPLSKKFPFIQDLARLERQVWTAFNAFDHEPMTPESVAQWPLEDWERAKIIFQPSVSLLAAEWPVLDLWLKRRKSQERQGFKVSRKLERILVGRRKDQVRCEVLDENQYQLIHGLLEGKTLGEACERLAEHVDETCLAACLPAGRDRQDSLPIASWFSSWVKDGLIGSCQFLEKSAVSKT